MSAAPSVHEQAALRLAGVDQRYTPARRAIVATLAAAGRPLTIPELLDTHRDLPQSSAYRTVTALIGAGVVRRVAGVDDHGRFELAEDLAGHHHHLACAVCGTVEDVAPSPRLERAMAEAARAVAEAEGYVVTGHQIDLVGTCPRCRAGGAGSGGAAAGGTAAGGAAAGGTAAGGTADHSRTTGRRRLP